MTTKKWSFWDIFSIVLHMKTSLIFLKFFFLFEILQKTLTLQNIEFHISFNVKAIENYAAHEMKAKTRYLMSQKNWSNLFSFSTHGFWSNSGFIKHGSKFGSTVDGRPFGRPEDCTFWVKYWCHFSYFINFFCCGIPPDFFNSSVKKFIFGRLVGIINMRRTYRQHTFSLDFIIILLITKSYASLAESSWMLCVARVTLIA